MKTLIVSYLPRGERSHTKKLVDTFVASVKGKGGSVEELSLIENVPDMFVDKNLIAYVKRNFLGEELSEDDKQLLSKMDSMTAQFVSADVVVFGFPMYNFSMPAIVKAYFDSIMQKGQTFDISEKGFEGLMKGKKSLILLASGGVYEGEAAKLEHAVSLTRDELNFMGFEEIESVTLGGVNAFPKEKVVEITEEKIGDVKNIVEKWYG